MITIKKTIQGRQYVVTAEYECNNGRYNIEKVIKLKIDNKLVTDASESIIASYFSSDDIQQAVSSNSR